MDEPTPQKPEHQPDTRLAEEELLKPGSAVAPHNPDLTADKPTSAPETSRIGKKTIDETDGPAEEEPKPTNPFVKLLKEIVITVVVVAGIVFVINNFIFQAYYVSGSSMEPDYHNSDYLIISKLPLTLNSVKSLFGARESLPLQRGDIVVFRYPNAPDTFFIKRVIGLPGDRVIVKDGIVTVYNDENPGGLVLKEPYIDPAYKTLGNVDTVVEPQHFFVMGDNRSPNGSFDSREWGQLDQKFITGIANVRLLPLNTFSLIPLPEY